MASMSVQARFKAQIKWGCKSLTDGARTMPRAAHAVLAAICQCRMRQQWPLVALVARGARAVASAAAARSLAGARDEVSSAMTSGPRRARATCAGRCGSRRVPPQRCARTSLAARHAVADMAPTTKACGAVDAHIPSVGCARANAAAEGSPVPSKVWWPRRYLTSPPARSRQRTRALQTTVASRDIFV